jgi:DNA-binding transcriptional LysR family regulator
MPIDVFANTSQNFQALAHPGHGITGHAASRMSHKPVNLAGIDLNLLVALDALVRERSVSLAAARVGLSQPAMSRALSRLRGLFHDELLVRSSAGYVLTRRGEQLEAELPLIMNGLRALLSHGNPQTDAETTALTLAMPDHQSLVLLQCLLDRLQDRAPHIDLATRSLQGNSTRQLEVGEIDLVLGCIGETGAGFYRRVLYTDRFACLVRNEHPILAETWNADRFAALRHAVVASPAEEGFAKLYEWLSDLQLPGRDPLIVPNAGAAPFIVAQSDMALILPMRVARMAASLLPLTVLEAPLELPPYEVSLLWHERGHRDPACMQLRAEIAAASLAVVQGSVRDARERMGDEVLRSDREAAA